MSKLTTISVTNKGTPVSGVAVTAGEMDVTLTTDSEGKVTANLADDFKRVITLAIDGEYFSTKFIEAGGTYEIKIDS